MCTCIFPMIAWSIAILLVYEIGWIQTVKWADKHRRTNKLARWITEFNQCNIYSWYDKNKQDDWNKFNNI